MRPRHAFAASDYQDLIDHAVKMPRGEIDKGSGRTLLRGALLGEPAVKFAAF
jgi:hypothetical protein